MLDAKADYFYFDLELIPILYVKDHVENSKTEFVERAVLCWHEKYKSVFRFLYNYSWTKSGFILKGYDISLEKFTHNVYGEIGRIVCLKKGFGRYSDEKNQRLFSELRRNFAMTPVRYAGFNRNFWYAPEINAQLDFEVAEVDV